MADYEKPKKPKKKKVKYDDVLKKFPKKGVKPPIRPRPPSQEELKAAWEAGDDLVGKRDDGTYYLD